MNSTDGPKKRRPRYKGTHPRKPGDRYKELNANFYAEDVEKIATNTQRTVLGTHKPICVAEIIQALQPKPGDTYLDLTLGYGGHAQAILPLIAPKGRLLGFDQDPIELPKTEARLREVASTIEGGVSLSFFNQNFCLALETLNRAKVQKTSPQKVMQNASKSSSDVSKEGFADLILADLGLSSMQIDLPERGFSTKYAGPLDLRMNPHKGAPASELLKEASPQKLTDIFRDYSDEPLAHRLAHFLKEKLQTKAFETTLELVQALEEFATPLFKKLPEMEPERVVRRTFQALRIAVNDEVNALKYLTRDLPKLLKPGGRVAILTFHSGEDRIVKKAFQAGHKSGDYSEISDNAIRASGEEVRTNRRAQSAKLRWAVRSR